LTNHDTVYVYSDDRGKRYCSHESRSLGKADWF
jgi:hypothetical protein